MEREQILTILYEMALVMGGEVYLQPLLTKTLQRLLYHTSFSGGMILCTTEKLVDEAGDPAKIEATLEMALGDKNLIGRIGEKMVLPAELLKGEAGIFSDLSLLSEIPCRSGYYSTILKLPVPDYGAILLLSPDQPSTGLP